MPLPLPGFQEGSLNNLPPPPFASPLLLRHVYATPTTVTTAAAAAKSHSRIIVTAELPPLFEPGGGVVLGALCPPSLVEGDSMSSGSTLVGTSVSPWLVGPAVGNALGACVEGAVVGRFVVGAPVQTGAHRPDVVQFVLAQSNPRGYP